jgi:pimeloyl-ACP methyl ester carboxylesterase
MVLCLHGFPDNANSFRYQIDDLVAAGYQILTPTMRGYEPSSITTDNGYMGAVRLTKLTDALVQ